MKRETTNPATAGSWPWRTGVVSWMTQLGVALMLAGLTTARAHDPYEITSQVFVHSNRIEVKLEMEFSAAMLLAGREARTESPGDEFARALPELRLRAGDFLRLAASGRPWPAIATNVALGVENHVNVELEYPATEASALRFDIGSLRALSEHGPYGTSLTVLDMVHQRVLAQSVLFGNSGPLELETGSARAAANPPVVLPQNEDHSAKPRTPLGRELFPNYAGLMVFGGAVVLLGLVGWLTRRRPHSN